MRNNFEHSTVMCTLPIFSVIKSSLFIRALLLDRILATEKTTRTPRVHLVYYRRVSMSLQKNGLIRKCESLGLFNLVVQRRGFSENVLTQIYPIWIHLMIINDIAAFQDLTLI